MTKEEVLRILDSAESIPAGQPVVIKGERRILVDSKSDESLEGKLLFLPVELHVELRRFLGHVFYEHERDARLVQAAGGFLQD